VSCGEFRAVDPDRGMILGHMREFLDQGLLADA
jgi:hypothetical protein